MLRACWVRFSAVGSLAGLCLVGLWLAGLVAGWLGRWLAGFVRGVRLNAPRLLGAFQRLAPWLDFAWLDFVWLAGTLELKS